MKADRHACHGFSGPTYKLDDALAKFEISLIKGCEELSPFRIGHERSARVLGDNAPFAVKLFAPVC